MAVEVRSLDVEGTAQVSCCPQADCSIVEFSMRSGGAVAGLAAVSTSGSTALAYPMNRRVHSSERVWRASFGTVASFERTVVKSLVEKLLEVGWDGDSGKDGGAAGGTGRAGGDGERGRGSGEGTGATQGRRERRQASTDSVRFQPLMAPHCRLLSRKRLLPSTPRGRKHTPRGPWSISALGKEGKTIRCAVLFEPPALEPSVAKCLKPTKVPTDREMSRKSTSCARAPE